MGIYELRRKLINKILAGRSISYKDAERILLKLGFELKVTASHHIFRKRGYSANVCLKRRSELLSYQIKMIQEVLEDHGYKKKTKDIKYYMNLPWTYTIETEQDEKGKNVYVVHVNELEGIATDAPTLEKAMKLIKEAMEGAFEMYLENGEQIPEPKDLEKYKGNIAYRTSSTRHYYLVKEAQKKNLSISQLIDQAIDSILRKR